jgi:fructuronate reductase
VGDAAGVRDSAPHVVDQLLADGASTKLRLRVVPVALLERSAGRPAAGCATAIAAWALFDGLDAEAALRDLSPELADDRMFANLVRTTLTTLAAE